MRPHPPQLAFTVDLEDWAQSTWDRDREMTSRCAYQGRRILEILGEVPSARATFFVLGKFAERHPHVVRDIHAAGHEVACHGWGHVEAFRLGRAAFTEDLRRATETISDITGVQPIGYRASDFSIVSESLWALEVLQQAGYHYSSSIFPVAKERYGIGNWPRTATCVQLHSGGSIVEAPLAALQVGARRVPIAGGGYARLLPGSFLTAALRQASKNNDLPVFYCHPYEVDSKEFRTLAHLHLPFTARLHQGLGRRSFPAKLRRVLRDFRCTSLASSLPPSSELPQIAAADYETPPQISRPSALRGAPGA